MSVMCSLFGHWFHPLLRLDIATRPRLSAVWKEGKSRVSTILSDLQEVMP